MAIDFEYLIIYCTCPDQQTAEGIARHLVDEYLAACVNIVPALTSIYRWQGQLEQSAESMLIIKTRADGYPALETRIKDLHPYAVPEIIALPVVRGISDYLAWIDASLSGDG